MSTSEPLKLAQQLVEVLTASDCGVHLIEKATSLAHELEAKNTETTKQLLCVPIKKKGNKKKRQKSKSKLTKTGSSKRGQNSENEIPTSSESNESLVSLTYKEEREWHIFSGRDQHNKRVLDVQQSKAKNKETTIRLKKLECNETWSIIKAKKGEDEKPLSDMSSSPCRIDEYDNKENQLEKVGASETASTTGTEDENIENFDDGEDIAPPIEAVFMCKSETDDLFVNEPEEMRLLKSEFYSSYVSNSASISNNDENADDPATPQLDFQNCLLNAEEEELHWMNNEIVVSESISLHLKTKAPCWETPSGKQRAQIHKRSAPSLKTASSKKRQNKNGKAGTRRELWPFDNITITTSNGHGVDTSRSPLGFYCLCRQNAFASKKSLQAHIKRDSPKIKDVKSYPCQLCTKKFKYPRCLNNHIDSVHLRRVTKTIVKKPKKGIKPMAAFSNHRIWCGECEIEFETKQEQYDHYGRTHYRKKKTPLMTTSRSVEESLFSVTEPVKVRLYESFADNMNQEENPESKLMVEKDSVVYEDGHEDLLMIKCAVGGSFSYSDG